MAKKVRKLHVKVKPVRLDGLPANPGDETAAKNLFAMVELKWKGPVSGFGLGLIPFYRSNPPVNHTSSKPISLGASHVEWEEEFERVCCLVGPWNISFNVFYGEALDATSKKTVIGKASLDLSEITSKLEFTVERKLPIRSKGLLSKEATLVVNVTFSEVRNEADDFIQLGPISVDSVISKKMASRRDSSNFDSSSSPATASSSSGVSPNLGTGSNSSPENQSEPGQKAGFNWWKRRRLSFSMTWRREPREDEATAKISSKPSEPEPEKPATAEDSSIEADKWVVKELVSRDRKSKLRSEVYTASIDQRSEQAGGETACAAVAVVVAHWFQANPRLINPSDTEFDSLIMQGSALWKSLCNDESYLRLFPNRHFDLETVVSAKLRPVRVCNDKSFTGLFSPERFASLEGLMSFDQIWDEVEKEVAIASGESRVYIVSWNDHFFVVKADLDGFCVIDSLGERLFEGCKQAYILKFDDSSLMYEKKGEEESSAVVVVCKGKECCREYIKRFLAAIPVAELAAKEEKGNVVDVSLLHEKLQIDLHHIMLTGGG